MKFDKRISSDLRDVYTLYCRNNDNLLGIEVYASNDIDDFNNIDRCRKGKVEFIDAVHGYAVKVDSENTCYFNFVIPAMCVKEKKKQYRPYTLKEFFDKFTIGSPIMYRKKGDVIERYLILNGYVDSERGTKADHYIYIGSTPYTLDELFNKYEWQASDTEEFKPFGVAV